jgi:transcription elongation GreA/GreB family factor
MSINGFATKQKLYQLCLDYVEQRIQEAKQGIADAQQASAGETKSSAGDKYETGRAMMQQEIDRNTQQLAEAMKLKNGLNRINADTEAGTTAGAGSLVITSNGNFYLAISAGNMIIEGLTYHVVSPASPIGLKLKGMRVKDTFVLNSKSYEVTELY